ncbi:MAG: hypothetical protein K2G03_05270, partial [Bacilli bacterium]|nr:hypothetical protein [Bacilli bacterium]
NIMDGKLLILCDELPQDDEHYSVKDVYFLRSTMIDPDDDPERLFVTWDAVIPKDRTFINKCHEYATTYEKMPADFLLRETGTIDPKHGNIRGSIQEDSFIHTLDLNIERIKKAAAKGEDYHAEALDLAVQYPMQATETFIEDFSYTLNINGIVRILPAHKSDTEPELVRYRTQLLEAWKNQNRFLREKAAQAKLLTPMLYDNFGEVHSRSIDEMMKIYALPIFGEAEEDAKKDHDSLEPIKYLKNKDIK